MESSTASLAAEPCVAVEEERIGAAAAEAKIAAALPSPELEPRRERGIGSAVRALSASVPLRPVVDEESGGGGGAGDTKPDLAVRMSRRTRSDSNAHAAKAVEAFDAGGGGRLEQVEVSE